jgi:hypothetical protein
MTTSNRNQPDDTSTANAPWAILNRNHFFIKDVIQRREAKTSEKFDVYDPNTRQLILECREPDLGCVTRLSRFMGGGFDEGGPFNLVAHIPESNQQVFRVARKSATLPFEDLRTEFFDHRNTLIACLKKKNFTIGLKFRFFLEKQDLFQLQIKSKSDWVALLVNQKEVAHMPKKCSPEHAQLVMEMGAGFFLSFAPEVPQNDPVRPLLLATSIAIGRISRR